MSVDAARRIAVEAFFADLRERVRHADVESQEALLVEPLRDLIRKFAQSHGRTDIDIRGQAQESGIGRPDFSVKDGPLLIGHIETKAPGLGADPGRFRGGHDRDQWGRFRNLPNLLYTDGLDFALYRSGERESLGAGRPARVRFDIDLNGHGAIAVADQLVSDLDELVVSLITWQPLPPRSLADLAERLAPLCATLRDAVFEGINIEGSALQAVTEDVHDALFPDTEPAVMADAFAQTCTYSMLLARSEGAPDLTAAQVEATLTHAHAVLARVVRVLLDPNAENEIRWAVDVVRHQIEVVDFDAFGQHGDDTWLYFYEQFLAAYDPKLRDSRGVFYTPRQVIQAQVTLTEEILRTRFGKDLGFAADGVTVLDPAVGTGSYPLAVIDAAAARAAAMGGDGIVPPAVTALAARLHAFELLVGPYAVAHMRLTERVRALGGTPPPGGVQVYLTDTLASPDIEPPELTANLRPLVAEQQRARKFKSNTPVVVCLGNPPYDREERDPDSPESKHKGGWVRYGDQDSGRPILADFTEPLSRAGLGRHAKNLYNDYVYFWRWALWKTFEHHPQAVEDVGGIVTFITAASYLRGPAFAFMRQRLRELCDDLYILDLGGEGRGTRRSENVFDILTPVAIAVAVREPGEGERAGRVHYADWSDGTRAEKFSRLAALTSLGDVQWRDAPTGEADPFLPAPEGDFATWPLLTDLLPWRASGVQVKLTWPIAPSEAMLLQRWARLTTAPANERAQLLQAGDRDLDSEPPPLMAGDDRLYPLSALDSSDPQARRLAGTSGPLVPFEFRTLDRQYLIRDERLAARIRPVLWRVQSNRQLYLTSLLTHPLGNGPAVSLATASPPDLHFFRGSYGGADVMPLYRDSLGQQPNFPGALLLTLRTLLSRDLVPEDVFAYVVGILGTGAYAARFSDELGTSPPRVPVASDPDAFEEVAEIGRRLAFLHSRGQRYARADWKLPEGSARIEVAIPEAVETLPREVVYDQPADTILIGSGRVAPVAQAVWDFEVSGYRVVQEWIGRRLAEPRGRHRSELDEIRPLAWDFDLQRELLTILAIVEEIVTVLTPAAEAILARVCAGNLITATDLPSASSAERKAPRLR